MGRFSGVIASVLLLLLLSGCTTDRSSVAPYPFRFETDTFSYANELTWDYSYNEKGKWKGQPRVPKPAYTLRCFVVARSAKQFYLNARFDPERPVADDETYVRKVRQVVGMSPRKPAPESKKVIIPGYANLREFSAARPEMLKENCGGAWQSYVQRGHWRMVFPFSRKHQARTALVLGDSLRKNWPVVVHVLRFPRLSINHALLAFAAHEYERVTLFSVYDPNDCDAPATLIYDHRDRTFYLPPNHYFPGGRVEVYQVYSDLLH